ncbi:MAG: hypothetical protein LAN63_17960 [Acidobacteriia bacterium]|nr:hypothetical protein [Terriglobia bacterium]
MAHITNNQGGTIMNSQTIRVEGGGAYVENNVGGLITNSGDMSLLGGSAYLANSGTIQNSNGGSISVLGGAAYITNSGVITNAGTISVEGGGAYIANNNQIYNCGGGSVTGDLTGTPVVNGCPPIQTTSTTATASSTSLTTQAQSTPMETAGFTHTFRFQATAQPPYPSMGVQGSGSFNYQTGAATGDGALSIGQRNCGFRFVSASGFQAGPPIGVTLTATMTQGECGPPVGHSIEVTIRTGESVFVDLKGYGFFTIGGTSTIEEIPSAFGLPNTLLILVVAAVVVAAIAGAAVFLLRRRRTRSKPTGEALVEEKSAAKASIPLATPAKPPASTGAVSATAVRYCTSCGSQIPAASKFCPGCGLATDLPAKSREPSGAAKSGVLRYGLHVFTDQEILSLKVISQAAQGAVSLIAIILWVLLVGGVLGVLVGVILISLIVAVVFSRIAKSRLESLATLSPDELIKAGKVRERISWSSVSKAEMKRNLLTLHHDGRKMLIGTKGMDTTELRTLLGEKLGEKLVIQS